MPKLSGYGHVIVKNTGEAIASHVAYTLSMSQSTAGVGHIDGHIGLDAAIARRCQQEGLLLTLSLEDGGYLDFWVMSAPAWGDGPIDVKPTGGIRADLNP